MSTRSVSTLLLGAAVLAGCQTKLNYEQPLGPRYAGYAPVAAPPPDDTLRIVSFNIEYAIHVDSAISVLKQEPDLRSADIVLLQEMDADGTRRIAETLGMWHAYYPATLHPRTGRDMGNAVLSRYPIVDDQKILLPHLGRLRGTRRAATAATVQIGNTAVRVYSVHLGTPIDVGPNGRRDQLHAILDDAVPFQHVVIGGDLNSGSVGKVASGRGYDWPTRSGPRTMVLGRWDHIFLKGMQTDSTGTVSNVRGASDHRPVWTDAILP